MGANPSVCRKTARSKTLPILEESKTWLALAYPIPLELSRWIPPDSKLERVGATKIEDGHFSLLYDAGGIKDFEKAKSAIQEARITAGDIDWKGCKPYLVQPTTQQSQGEAYWVIEPNAPKLVALKTKLENAHTPAVAGKIKIHLTLITVKRSAALDAEFPGKKLCVQVE
jgi:hypothetical protein